jgi:hypothetical protein
LFFSLLSSSRLSLHVSSPHFFYSSVVFVANVSSSNEKALHILNFHELAFQWI